MITETLTFQELARYASASKGKDDEDFLTLKFDFTESMALRDRLYRSEVFCILLCTRGEMSVSIDLTRYDLRRNTLLLLRPGSTLSVHSFLNFSGQCIVFDPALRSYLPIPGRDMTDLQLKAIQHPVTHLSIKERLRLRRMYDTFLAAVECSRNIVPEQFVRWHAVAMLLYTIGDLLQRDARPHCSARTRRDEYFSRFIRLASQYFTTERSVMFYAEKMNLTPKYLTTVIREVSGKTASEWIDELLIQEACYRLLSGGHSIQQIAYSLNFPNQSFFGSFFKNKTGISPSSYRLKSTNRC